jgi:hypothetical protein
VLGFPPCLLASAGKTISLALCGRLSPMYLSVNFFVLCCLLSPLSSFFVCRCHMQGVPTEREVLTVEQGLPVYRMMLRRI